jgi:hypothetical protein
MAVKGQPFCLLVVVFKVELKDKVVKPGAGSEEARSKTD